MSDYEYEIKKTGNNEYRVTPIPAAGCGAGCGIIGPILLGFIGFLLLGNAFMDDGGSWVWEILSNPLVAVPLFVIVGIPVIVLVIGFIAAIVSSKK